MEGRYLSLKAFRIRSTSSSRWKADASRLRSFSSSRSEVDVGGVGGNLDEEEVWVDIPGPVLVSTGC